MSDAAVICLASAAVTMALFAGQPSVLLTYAVGSAALAASWMAALGLTGYRVRRVVGRDVGEYMSVTLATLQLFGLIAIGALLLHVDVSRTYLAVVFAVGLLGLLTSRLCWRRVAAAELRRDEHQISVLVVGSARTAADVATNFVRDPGAGYRVVGICTPTGPTAQNDGIDVDGRHIPIVGIDQAIVDAVRHTNAHTVALAATDHLHPTEIRRLIWELDSLGVDLMIAPGLVDIAEDRLHSRPIAGMAMFEVAKPQYDGANSAAKRVFDVVFTLAAMTIMAPVFFLAALAVRLSGPGPVFYASERIGFKGTTFTMLKFRSMVDGADANAQAMIAANGSDPVFWKDKDDPRITHVGKIIRKYSIDELPQFINVLRGDMSVVGPRPQVRREVDSYDDLVRRRLTVKPGLTGLWQVSGRSDLPLEDAVRLDLSYIENWSPIRDLVIIAKTIKTVLSGEGAY
ncbi:UDP-phosphate galactose phosphotransferase [Mycolicibacterium aromaticivorans JS19b1 = JCM 16368]|uniref:UDP-phosphate galactose phosphotransferase n=1 Tax=Mycolicibacterium aromaticivorans JS19b1 = JCM 16368 TaxID=1440774 RepID=A0A064CJL8_9MYCO|nr:sugar transferase [Mycolicibacterium aromaticivorans]KDF00541.1 UDP-phosphate galactose phosphotransferase [Mycolicibacterium aromaticivorans JS19b1 = JCM 16368]